jgi:ABC-type lipoprotein export system ATPase subunit
MTISLQQLVPIPLAEKILQRTSDVWNTQQVFTKGQFVKIKAPSGTGKTTLIHTIYGLRNDYSGVVLYNDVNINTVQPEQLATIRQKQLSVIFQDLRLFPQLTAYENIMLKFHMHSPYTTEQQVLAMAEQLGITHILQRSAAICSYGEQQRIAIIRALVQPFDLLLMDEPFSHLDHANTLRAAQLIADACTQRGAGFVLTDLDDDDHFAYHKKMNL